MFKKFLRKLFPYLVYVIYRLFVWSWKINIEEPFALTEMLKNNEPFLIAHWHGDEYSIIHLSQRYRIGAMVSTSDDGEMMNTFLQLLGAKTSRGSSTRGGASALRGLIRFVKEENVNPSVAVDGPRGPIHKIKPGLFEISRLMGLPIFVMGIATDRAFRSEKAWNKGYLPKPFARLNIVWQGPFGPITKGQDPRDSTLALTYEQHLFDASHQAAKLIAGTNS